MKYNEHHDPTKSPRVLVGSNSPLAQDETTGEWFAPNSETPFDGEVSPELVLRWDASEWDNEYGDTIAGRWVDAAGKPHSTLRNYLAAIDTPVDLHDDDDKRTRTVGAGFHGLTLTWSESAELWSGGGWNGTSFYFGTLAAARRYFYPEN